VERGKKYIDYMKKSYITILIFSIWWFWW